MGRKQSLRRTTGTKQERKVLLVFTEGQVTETAYVNALRRLDHVRRSTAIIIELAAEHAVPYRLVEAAVRTAADSEVDQVWCLLDVEAPQRHPRLADTVALAARHDKVRLAFSNPCFEVWLLLHDRDVGAFLSTAEAERAAQGLRGVSGKTVDAPSLVELRTTAATRARALRARHQRNVVAFPDNNPSSDVDLFVAAVESRA